MTFSIWLCVSLYLIMCVNEQAEGRGNQWEKLGINSHQADTLKIGHW